VTERTIRNKTRIGEQLSDIADQLKETPIADSQKDLLALAQLHRMAVQQRNEAGAVHHKGGAAEGRSAARPEVRNKTREEEARCSPLIQPTPAQQPGWPASLAAAAWL
jgi:hypothetical protein